MDARYYPRQVGGRGTLSKNDRREQSKRKAVSTWLGREGSEKPIPEVEVLEGKIMDLRSQLHCAAQIIVAKDNDLEGLNKEKEKLQQAEIKLNRKCAKLEICCGRKEFSIVGPMQGRDGS